MFNGVERTKNEQPVSVALAGSVRTNASALMALAAVPAAATDYPATVDNVRLRPSVTYRRHFERPRWRKSRPVGRTLKRLVDIALSGLALLVAAPLFLMIAAMIKLTMGGPVIFGHARIGRNGQQFKCYKFRSMVPNGDEVLRRYLDEHPEAQREWVERQKLETDPRVTYFGRLLRRSSLDELPQFYNIFRGDMSCVGPRPIVEGELARYGDCAAEYLSVRPGLTGVWQVSGRSKISYEKRVELDAEYVRNWSLMRDVGILLRTIPAVLKHTDAA